MKKLFPLFLVLLTASSIFAQEQGKAVSTTPSNGGSNVVIGGRLVTDADNGKTITLSVGEGLFVYLPDESRFVSGDQEHGIKCISTVSFGGSSTDGILSPNIHDIGDDGYFEDNTKFTADRIGNTTLSYKRITSYMGYGGCPTPMCVAEEPISFNIVVTQ